MDCNATLPWRISSQDHLLIPNDRTEELLRCPDGLHGCSASPVNCKEELLAVTCSCGRNCDVYGSCCWNTEVHESTAARSKCISLAVANGFSAGFYAVSGCSRDWPKDEVRMSCENVTNEHDPFFFIPVTTERRITYFNAFCALCNYDLENSSMFWNALGSSVQDLTVYTLYVMDNKDASSWPCDSTLVDVDACPEGADAEIMRRCSTYFAPDTSPYSRLLFSSHACSGTSSYAEAGRSVTLYTLDQFSLSAETLHSTDAMAREKTIADAEVDLSRAFRVQPSITAQAFSEPVFSTS
ncbi:hypothetical protein MTO96_008563 [Rhipicephalus appendiculatus]